MNVYLAMPPSPSLPLPPASLPNNGRHWDDDDGCGSDDVGGSASLSSSLKPENMDVTSFTSTSEKIAT